MRKTLMWMAAAAAATAMGAPISGTIVTDNGSKTGAITWSARAKTYTIAQKQGGAVINVEVPAAEVVELNIPKPAGFDAAVAQVAKGQGAAAVPALQKMVKEYQGLQWDRAAGRWLSEAYVAAGKPDDALRACAEIIKADPTAAYKGELAPAYWNALLKLNKKGALEKALKQAAACGDRYSSGAALLLRGDQILQEGGDSADAAKQALADGYLRVVLMYTEPEVAAKLRAEALYKAATCFEKLGQSGRADGFRTELKTKFGSTPWAAK